MSVISFTKMVGAGNDFIIIDNRAQDLREEVPAAARRLSQRKFSVGSDGLILLEKASGADIGMRMYNPDGSEADMCGNGVRCLAKFAAEKKLTGPRLTIATRAGLIHAEVSGDIVRVKMADPKDMKLGLSLDVLGRKTDMHFVNTGVPHAVCFVDALEDTDVFTLGRAIRRHAHFSPAGTNANFVSLIQGDNAVRVRTYERGVEDETLSCGTGSTASAIVAAAVKGLDSPVSVQTRGGDVLRVYFIRQGEHFREVHLEGPVLTAFEGSVSV